MEKNCWTEQHSQLWSTPKRSTTSPLVGHSLADEPLDKVETSTQLSANQIVKEILHRLEGTSTAECNGETSLQDDLYRVLMKVEECEESVETALGRLGVQQYGTSLSEKTKSVEIATALRNRRSSEKGIDERHDEGTLRHVVDVLRTYGDIDSKADTVGVLLSILKDYEQLKSRAVSNGASDHDQQSQLQHRLAFYGELARGSESPMELKDHWRPWIETPLTFLYDEVSKALAETDEPAMCSVCEPFLSENAELSRRNITAVLNSATACAARLVAQQHDSSSTALRTRRSDGGTGSLTSDGLTNTCFGTTVKALINGLPSDIVNEFRLEQLAACESSDLPAALLESIRTLVTRREEGTDKSLFIVNSLDRSLKRAFHLSLQGSGEDAALSLPGALQHLEKTVADVLAYPHESPQRESELKREVASAVDELAQLLPTSSEGALPISSGIRIEAPTSNLTEIVQLLKTRFLAWSHRQQKQLVTGAHRRSEQDRVLEAVAKHVKDLHGITLEMSAARLTDATPNAGVPGTETVEEHNSEASETFSSALVEAQLSSLLDRLRALKTQYFKMNQDTLSLRSRLEASTQKNTTQAKSLKRAAVSATKLCELLRVDENWLKELARKEGDGDKSTPGETQTRLSLRPVQDRSPRGKSTAQVTEANLLDALRAIEVRVSGDTDLLKKSEAEQQETQAVALANKYEKDKAAFAQAMRMILLRLAESGELIKQSLFMLGTDEAASDDAISDALSLLDSKDEDGELVRGDSETVERLLAALLQKYARWSRRLCETTEDHLVTQQKIVRYFTAIRRFFSPPENASTPGADVSDENLIDIDTSLMRSADVILPALDRAIRATEGGQSPATAPGGRGTANRDPEARRKEAVEHLAALSSSKSTVLPYDHRLGRLYDMISRLYTAVTSLQRVRYLAIPSEVKRRSSGDVELAFDDGYSASDYIDLDLDKLVADTAAAETPSTCPPARFTRQDATSMSSAVQGFESSSALSTRANDDRILQAATQNLDCVQQALKKFSSDHKLSAIVIQKDTDTMQQLLAGMLEKYSELDVEKAFGQDRGQLRELYTVLHDRAARQKGCYFFNRVGGEGKCAWVVALEQLSVGFSGVIDKLIQRTDLAAKYRDLIDDVVDLCAMFVNWSAQHPPPPGYELPKDVVDDYVHEGCASDSGDDANRNSHATPTSGAPRGSLPPMLPRPGVPVAMTGADKGPSAAGAASSGGGEAAKAVVSHFQHDETVVKVIEGMFRLVQASSEKSAQGITAGATPVLEEELALLRETIAVADQRAVALAEEKRLIEQERDKAQSEAAVARAELRRARQDAGSPGAASPGRPLLPNAASFHNTATAESAATSGADAVTTQSSSRAATNSIDQDCLEELLQYMKVLGHELRYGQSVARAEERTPFAPYDDEDDASASLSDTRNVASPTEMRTGELGSCAEDEEDAYAAPTFDQRELTADDMGRAPMTRLGRLKALEQRLQDEYQGAVVVDATPLRRKDGAVSAGAERRRYSPSRHRGGDYEVCEGCVRHHRQPMPRALQDPPEDPQLNGTATLRANDRQHATPTVHRPELVEHNSTARRTRTQPTGVAPFSSSSSRTPQRSRPQLGTSRSSSTRATRTTSHQDLPDAVPDRFFDDDIQARAHRMAPRQHNTDAAELTKAAGPMRPSSARRTHPLRTTPLTPRPTGQGYDGTGTTLAARSSLASPYMPATPQFRGTAHNSRQPNSAHPTRTTPRSASRVGRAKSPDHFDAALQSVQAAGRLRSEDDHGINISPRPQSSSAYPDSANLRSAALRRLAEVVSQTKVKGRGGRYY